MAVFHEATSGGDAEFWPLIGVPSIDVTFRHPKAVGAHRAVIVAVSYRVRWGEIEDLTCKATYNDIDMPSLGLQPFDNDPNEESWLEVFGIVDAPTGGRVRVVLSGEFFAPRWLRATSVSYTGVEALGAATLSFGSSTAVSAQVTAPAAGVAVQAFGTRTGLTGLTQRQRYVNNTGIALAVGDADGDGSATTFAATLQKAIAWAGIGVSLSPADLVASAQPLIVEPRLDAAGRRLPRPSIPPRVVYTIEPEA